MYISVWMGDRMTLPDLTGPFAVFYTFNVTSGQLVVPTLPRVSATADGYEAEWIMETPQRFTIGPFPTKIPGTFICPNVFLYGDLAHYEPTFMFSAYASPVKSNAKWISYQEDTNLQVTMVNGIKVLSSVEPIDFVVLFFFRSVFLNPFPDGYMTPFDESR